VPADVRPDHEWPRLLLDGLGNPEREGADVHCGRHGENLRDVDAVALGLALGLGAGLAPGPLTAVMVAATLDRGFAAGARVAVAPLLTDVPIVALCMLVLQGLPDRALAGLSIAGAAFVAYLAVDALRAEESTPARSDLRRGALVNALSPHPWLFWITVGGPILADAADSSTAAAVGFVTAFYALLVGAKLAVAGLVAAGRRDSWRRAVRPVSAGLLGLAAVALLADGISRL
jgi:threonine/homoserine/homoserine lactone efflux protein